MKGGNEMEREWVNRSKGICYLSVFRGNKVRVMVTLTLYKSLKPNIK